MTIHVTETQRFIAISALEAIGADDRFSDLAVIDDMIRAMLVIERGGMQAYILRGFNWSCNSRQLRQPFEVKRDQQNLDHSVEWFHEYIDRARVEPARRIRANRRRRIRALIREAQLLQGDVNQRMQELMLYRGEDLDLEPINMGEHLHYLPALLADQVAA